MDLLAKAVGDERPEARPDDRTSHVEDAEAPGRHPGRPRKKGGIGAQDRDESPEEDDLASVSQEQVPAQLDPGLVQPNVLSESNQEAEATPVPDGIAAGASDHRARPRRRDDERQGHLGGGARVYP